ncbi:MAG: SGNH/GDSL hydrolase family protein [Verrucomicrobia bacterium]|nr:SGNH/GDSL hydrolase family protein [Verrucomicrobiota bacterium]
MGTESPTSKPDAALNAETPFGSNEMRLDARQWLIVLAVVALAVLLTPPLWGRIERFNPGPDYRIPYSLSKDYWLYGRRLHQVCDPNRIIMLGDSVVWGEYVLPDGTLSHFLNREAGERNRFINAGLNGMFPLAMEGLLERYGRSLRQQRVILHCNVLWMTSPKTDLSADEEEPFNHSRLVPQFSPRIPCYKADANERLSALVEQRVGFVSWVNHLQNVYFGQKGILNWTMENDGGRPPRCPNLWRNPLAQITLTVPSGVRDDAKRGPKSPRHKPWSASGASKTRFDWVALESSLQWGAFQRLVGILRERGNDVLVVLGPFNEHLMTEESQRGYRKHRDGITAWLSQNQVPHLVPELLPSALYADASHPLTEGYELLAKRIYSDESFRKWLQRK